MSILWKVEINFLNKMNKKLYIGCAITHVPEDKKVEFSKMIEKIKAELKDDFKILEFWNALSTKHYSIGTPQDVYSYDIKECLMNADGMLAICDYYGLGLGYELGVAVEKKGIPVLAMAHKDSLVSRIIRGIDHPNFKFMTYNSPEEISKQARIFFSS